MTALAAAASTKPAFNKVLFDELTHIKGSLYDLFHKALSGASVEGELASYIERIYALDAESGKLKITLYTQALLYSMHLSYWSHVKSLITHELSSNVTQGNLIAILWKAGFEGEFETCMLLLKNHRERMRHRDGRFVFLAKKSLFDKMDYFSPCQETD